MYINLENESIISYQLSIINRQSSISKLRKIIYIYRYIYTNRNNDKYIYTYTDNATTSPTASPEATNAQQAYKHTPKDKSCLQGRRKPHTGRKQKDMKLYAQNTKAAQNGTSGAKMAVAENRCRLFLAPGKKRICNNRNASKHAGTRIRSFFKMTISSFR